MARPNPAPNRPVRGPVADPGPSPSPEWAGRVLLSALAAIGLWTGAESRVPHESAPACVEARESRARRVGEEWMSARIRCDGKGGRLRGPARLLFGERLDLNRAGPETLQVLPGIGPARARAIVEGRSLRPYERVEQLQRVRGIGPKRLEHLEPYLMVETPMTGGFAPPVHRASGRETAL